MIPVFVLVAAFAVFRLLGFAVPYFADWQPSLRAALGVMFLLTASAHRGRRRADLLRMVPPGFGNAALWVTLTGIAEVLIAVGLQFPRIALFVAILAAVMLICIFPANAKAAREKLTIAGRPVPSFGVRLLIQIVFLAALAAAVWPI
jgi:uncharacterized membrane protein